jgi:hypothetical protein
MYSNYWKYVCKSTCMYTHTFKSTMQLCIFQGLYIDQPEYTMYVCMWKTLEYVEPCRRRTVFSSILASENPSCQRRVRQKAHIFVSGRAYLRFYVCMYVRILCRKRNVEKVVVGCVYTCKYEWLCVCSKLLMNKRVYNKI